VSKLDIGIDMKMIISLIFILTFIGHAHGEAYCSLRDPVTQIRTLFPTKTNQLSIVKRVDERIRKQVKKSLPRNNLHFSELGKHTLYVALNKRKILGYVHVRSEQSQWGLVEIAWAINSDLTIKGFSCQRCRNPKRNLLEQPQFKQLFIDKNFQQLKLMLSIDGTNAKNEITSQAQHSSELTSIVLRSALKTLLITDLLWSKELSQLEPTH